MVYFCLCFLSLGVQRTNNAAVFSDIQIPGASISGSSSSQTVTIDDKESTLEQTTNKMRTISINDPPTYPIAKEPEKPKGGFQNTFAYKLLIRSFYPPSYCFLGCYGLKNLEDGLYMATAPTEDIQKKHAITMAPGVIHRPQPKTTSNVVDEAKLNIMRENLKTRANQAREGNLASFLGIQSAMSCHVLL